MKPKEGINEYNKIKKNDSPSPMSYDKEAAFIKTQIKEPRFHIPKAKKLSITDIHILKNKFVPGIGSYNTENSFEKITKGLAKGWK